MKTNSLIFATSNKNKLKEVQSILGVSVTGTSLEINEIQSLDPIKVAVEKAKSYFKELKKPLFVEDTSLSFKALNGLPGTYISDFERSLNYLSLAGLANGNRKATAQVTVVFIDKEGKEHIFIGRVNGTISAKPRGKNGFGWDVIFIPEGERRTFAEMTAEEKNKYSMRRIAFESFAKWLHKS